MGNLSDNFNKEDFLCRCGNCHKEFRISLTLIGILEKLLATLQIPIKVSKGYVCENAQDEDSFKKNYHTLGKALHIDVAGDKIIEVFRYLEKIPEITGLGINLQQNYIHIDLRDKEPVAFIIENHQTIELTDNNRQKYNLGEPVARQEIPAPKTLDFQV